MTNSREDSKKVILDNLSRNVELYNKYMLLLSSIFISALTAVGNAYHFRCFLKLSIFLFSIALIGTLTEIAILIIQDWLQLNIIQCNILKKIPAQNLQSVSEWLAILSLIGFLSGIIVVNIFVFTL